MATRDYDDVRREKTTAFVKALLDGAAPNMRVPADWDQIDTDHVLEELMVLDQLEIFRKVLKDMKVAYEADSAGEDYKDQRTFTDELWDSAMRCAKEGGRGTMFAKELLLHATDSERNVHHLFQVVVSAYWADAHPKLYGYMWYLWTAKVPEDIKRVVAHKLDPKATWWRKLVERYDRIMFQQLCVI